MLLYERLYYFDAWDRRILVVERDDKLHDCSKVLYLEPALVINVRENVEPALVVQSPFKQELFDHFAGKVHFHLANTFLVNSNHYSRS